MRHGLRATFAVAALAAFCSPLAAQQPQPVTAQWFTGSWSDTPDCRVIVHFLGDGRFVTAAGGEGRWRLDGTDIVFTAQSGGEERRMPIVRLGQNTARSGTVTSYRCSGRSPGD